jgi:hypothetical protein
MGAGGATYYCGEVRLFDAIIYLFRTGCQWRQPIGFKLLHVLVALRLARRRPVWTNVTANLTTEWVPARQINEAVHAAVSQISQSQPLRPGRPESQISRSTNSTSSRSQRLSTSIRS